MGFSALMAFVIIAFSGCDKVDNLNTVNFDADFTTNLDCNVPALAERAIVPTFGASAIINPTDDPNVNIYLNNIEEYEIQSVKATITSLSQENVTIVTAYLLIKNFQSTAQWDFNYELLSVGKTLTLGNENGEWDTVAGILKDRQEITVLITGESDFAGVTFTIKVDIETKVKAKII
jgi:hypothetical protein